VSWLDARRFCRWLTEKERKSGAIGPLDEYRLPTDDEWTAAAGPDKYAWGNQWPPPEKAGNMCGLEIASPLGYAPVAPGYNDGYPFTSPVGTFMPNRYGIYDMVGNVGQWCLDWYRPEMNSPEIIAKLPWTAQGVAAKTRRVVRGSNWYIGHQLMVESGFHSNGYQSARSEMIGFRCVLVIRTPKDGEPDKKP
jgi:formylglycine-generating enzyme required for sulfatase activity